MKGRASGTPKSDDPNKKKRKRVARERDLCDVKIKITEYFPTAGALEDVAISENILPDMHSMFPLHGNNAFSVLSAPSSNLPDNHPGANGKRYFTIQRVNGTGVQGQGLGCGHQHTLEDSDRVKKNSVQRILLKEDKERKKTVVCFSLLLFVHSECCMYVWASWRWLGITPQNLMLRHGQDRAVVTRELHRLPHFWSSYCNTAGSLKVLSDQILTHSNRTEP